MCNVKIVSKPAFLPVMVDGEMLYGWIGYYHRLNSFKNSSQTSMQIFGNISSGSQIGFPSRLSHFVAVTEGVFGDVEKLAYERSLFGLYAPFLPESVVASTLSRMMGSGKGLKWSIGVSNNWFDSTFQLKACFDCMREDVKKHGVTKWYLEHQWPISHVCRKHHVELKVVKRDCLMSKRKGFLLPQYVPDDAWDTSYKMSPNQISQLMRLVDFGACLAQRKNFNFNPVLLRYTYLLGAKKHGCIRTDRTVSVENLRDIFIKHYKDILNLTLFKSGLGDIKYIQMMTKLMRKSSSMRHPIPHILLMAMFFESPVEFESTYEEVSAAFSVGGELQLGQLLDHDLGQKLRMLIEGEDMFLYDAAKTLNIGPHCAGKIAREEGIEKKQLIEGGAKELRLRHMIINGSKGGEIVCELGIKRQSLDNYLFKRPELRDYWHQAKHENTKHEYRLIYKKSLENNNISSLSGIPSNHRSKFNWLRKHDFGWLLNNSPSSISSVLMANRNGNANTC